MKHHSFNVDSFKAGFLGAQKAYLFWITISWPGAGNMLANGVREGLAGGVPDLDSLRGAGESAFYGAVATGVDVFPFFFNTSDASLVPFYVKSTSLPQASLEEMTTNWMGAKYKFAGKNTFEDWTVSFYLDRDLIILKRFKQWMEMINDPQTNIISKPSSYMVDQMAFLLNNEGNTSSVYKFYGAWPKSIGNISLDYTETGLATVDITFSFQYFKMFQTEPGTVSEMAKKFLSSGVQGLEGIVESFTEGTTTTFVNKGDAF